MFSLSVLFFPVVADQMNDWIKSCLRRSAAAAVAQLSHYMAQDALLSQEVLFFRVYCSVGISAKVKAGV